MTMNNTTQTRGWKPLLPAGKDACPTQKAEKASFADALSR
jgi:hypothetical protein